MYKATDLDTGMLVAVKIGKPSNNATLRREAELMKRFNHPSLLNVLADGECRRAYFFVTPFMPGGSLQDQLNQKRSFSVLRALPIIYRIAGALDYIHNKGVIHRDVKPSNIVFDDNGLAYLTDFDVALGLAEEHIEEVSAAGTPLYMSSEAVLAHETVDRRTDVYSLGVVLYQMLTTIHPLRGRNIGDILSCIIYWDPLPLRFLNPKIPKAVEDVVLKAIEKPTSRRYQSAGEFALALETASKETLTEEVLSFQGLCTGADPEE